jgi:hypothetical protein
LRSLTMSIAMELVYSDRKPCVPFAPSSDPGCIPTLPNTYVVARIFYPYCFYSPDSRHEAPNLKRLGFSISSHSTRKSGVAGVSWRLTVSDVRSRPPTRLFQQDAKQFGRGQDTGRESYQSPKLLTDPALLQLVPNSPHTGMLINYSDRKLINSGRILI